MPINMGEEGGNPGLSLADQCGLSDVGGYTVPGNPSGAIGRLQTNEGSCTIWMHSSARSLPSTAEHNGTRFFVTAAHCFGIGNKNPVLDGGYPSGNW